MILQKIISQNRRNGGRFDYRQLPYKITSQPLFVSAHKKHFRLSFNVWSKLYRREVIEGFAFVSGIHFEDYPFVYAVWSKSPRTLILDEKLYFYTINPQSISNLKHNPKQIRDYAAGIKYLIEVYEKIRPQNTRGEGYLKRTLVPRLLRHQLKRCRQADTEVQAAMYREFAAELRESQARGWLTWRGNWLFYLTYRQIIRHW